MKKSIYSLLLFVATQLIGTIIGAAILLVCSISGNDESVTLSSIMSDSNFSVKVTILGLLISEVFLFLILWGIRYFHPRDLIKPVNRRIMLTVVLLILAALYVLNMINSAMDLPNIMEAEFNEIAQSLTGVICIAVLGPVIEEIVFRRIIIDDCIKRTGKPWAAILISSAMFGIIHLNPAQMLFAFLTGIVFGWIYVRTKSILPTLVGHIINNSIGVIEMRSGTSQPDVRFYQDTTLLISVIACAAVTVILARILYRQTLGAGSESDGSTFESVE